MPYKMIYIRKDGKRIEIKPLAFDNPKSEFGFEDRKIERKCSNLAAYIKKLEHVNDCYVEHY